MDFWGSVASNLFSDVLFVLLTIAIGWIVFILSKRTRMLKFFGIDANRRLVIYLSDLKLKSGQTFGVDDKRRMYAGSAVAFGEMQSANKFRDLFNYLLPSLSEAPNFLSKLLISDVQIQMQRAPSSEAQVEKSASFITLGSPAYNLASGFVEHKLHSKAKFSWGKSSATSSYSSAPDTSYEPMGVVDVKYTLWSLHTKSYAQDEPEFLTAASPAEAPNMLPSGDKSSENSLKPMQSRADSEGPTSIIVDDIPNLTEPTSGFVERIIDHEQKRIVFYVAGISELSTVGAANYLISEWEKLQRKYGDDKNFLIMLKVDSADSKKWNVTFEK